MMKIEHLLDPILDNDSDLQIFYGEDTEIEIAKNLVDN